MEDLEQLQQLKELLALQRVHDIGSIDPEKDMDTLSNFVKLVKDFNHCPSGKYGYVAKEALDVFARIIEIKTKKYQEILQNQ